MFYVPSIDEIEEEDRVESVQRQNPKTPKNPSKETPIQKKPQPQILPPKQLGPRAAPTSVNQIHTKAVIAKPLLQKPPVVTKPSNEPQAGHQLIVNERQRENPMVKAIHLCKCVFNSSITPDFILSEDTAAIFLSLRYHLLQPDYVKKRATGLGTKYRLNILICLVDTKDPNAALRQLNKFCLFAGLTFVVCWSNAEAARYVETYKIYANKTTDSIKANIPTNLFEQFTNCLTTVRTVNNTDALTMIRNFGSMKNIMKASHEQLLLCPGIGEKKVRQMYDAFHKPLITLSPQKAKRRRTDLDSFVRTSGEEEPKQKK